jgi:hypothetical protein
MFFFLFGAGHCVQDVPAAPDCVRALTHDECNIFFDIEVVTKPKQIMKNENESLSCFPVSSCRKSCCLFCHSNSGGLSLGHCPVSWF